MFLCLTNIYEAINLKERFNSLNSRTADDIDGFTMKIENEVIDFIIKRFSVLHYNSQVIPNNAKYHKFFFKYCSTDEQLKSLNYEAFLNLGFTIYIDKSNSESYEFELPTDETAYESYESFTKACFNLSKTSISTEEIRQLFDDLTKIS